MELREIKKLGKKIVRRVLKKWNKYDAIGREEFNGGLYVLIRSISQETNVPIDVISGHTDKVVEEFAEGYKKLPDSAKGHETLIMFLYLAYMKKLGILNL